MANITAADKPRTIRFGVPIVLLLILLAILTGGLLQVAVHGQDRVASEASETIAAAAFNAERESLERLSRDYSWWNAAVENLVFDYSPVWVEENLDWLPENFGVSRVFVLGPKGEPIYAGLNAAPVAADDAAWSNPGLLALTARARARPDKPEESVSAYVGFADGEHLVSASKLLQEADTSGHPSYPDKAVLAVSYKIDEALLNRIEKNFHLSGLTVQARRPDDAALAELTLAGPGGDPLAWITWSPPQPGSRLLEWLALPLGIVFVLVAAVIGLIIARARRAGVALQRAFEARVAAQRQLEYSARHDPLTDLPNRALFLEHLTTAMAHAERYGTTFTLHYLDLDGFKEVNDTFGHPVGDDLLRELSARLRRIVRAADTIARFGGDEFAVLQRSTSNRDDADLLAQRMIDAVREPFDVAGHAVRVTLSIGIAFDTGGGDPEQIIRKADHSLYRAKDRGGGRFEHYDPGLDDHAIVSGNHEHDHHRVTTLEH